MIRYIIKTVQHKFYRAYTEYTLTIKQHKLHAMLQTKKSRKKGGLCIDLNKNPRGKRLFGLLFKIHTQMLQHKAAVKKEAAVKR